MTPLTGMVALQIDVNVLGSVLDAEFTDPSFQSSEFSLMPFGPMSTNTVNVYGYRAGSLPSMVRCRSKGTDVCFKNWT